MPLLAALAMTATLVACTPGGLAPTSSTSSSPSPPPTSESPPPTTTPSASETSPPPVDASLTLPECEGLLSIAEVRAFYGPYAESIMSGVTAAEVMQGPVATATVAEASQTRVCTWGIPNSDGGFNVVAAEIPQVAATNLIAALRGAGTFTETTASGVTMFTRELDSGIGAFAVTYAFIGTAWVTVAGTISTEGTLYLADKLMASVRAANPGAL